MLQRQNREGITLSQSHSTAGLLEEYQALTDKQDSGSGLSEAETARLEELRREMDAAEAAQLEAQRQWAEGKQEVTRRFAELRKMIEAIPA